MRRIVLAAGAQCLALAAGWAIAGPGEVSATAPADSLEVGAFLDWAEGESAELRAYRADWQATRARAPVVGALPDPVLRWGYAIEPVETRVGPQRQRFGLSQRFPPWGARGMRAAAAEERAAASGATWESRRLQWRAMIARLWLDQCFWQAKRATLQEHVALLAQLERVARARYQTAELSHARLMHVQLELARAEHTALVAEETERALGAQLNSTLGRAPEAPVPAPRLTGTAAPVDTLGLMARMLDQSPELERQRAALRAAEHAEAAAKREGWPGWTLGLEVVDIASVPGIPASGDDAVVATAAVNLPIWRGKTGGKVDEARALRLKASAQLEDRRRELTGALAMQLTRLDEHERLLALYTSSLLPRAQATVHVLERAFTHAAVDLKELVDAIQTRLDLELELERATLDVLAARVELEALLGAPLAPREVER